MSRPDWIYSDSFTYREEDRALLCDHCGEIVEQGISQLSYRLHAPMNGAKRHLARFGRDPKRWTMSYFFPRPPGQGTRLWLVRETEEARRRL